nr:MAG TPA_asm: hypothetical protein [Bacteriophage sp.]
MKIFFNSFIYRELEMYFSSKGREGKVRKGRYNVDYTL